MTVRLVLMLLLTLAQAVSVHAQTNTPPFISQSPNQSTIETVQITNTFTVGDAETPAENLTVRLLSSNEALLPAIESCGTDSYGYCFGGSGSNRTVTLKPGCNDDESGTIITLIVSDEAGATATNSFQMNVHALQPFLFIETISDQVTQEGTTTQPIPVRVLMRPCNATRLTLLGQSSVQSLVSDTNIVFQGSGTNRTMTITPQTNRFGRASISVFATDGFNLTQYTLALTVTASLSSDWKDGSPVLMWTATNSILQAAETPLGDWKDLSPPPLSPYTLTAPGMKFHRLRMQ